MKKKLFLVCMSVLAAMALFMGSLVVENSKRQCNTSDLLLFSTEALSRDESAPNTGPREEKNCHGGYHKMVCMTMNHESCTDSECY